MRMKNSKIELGSKVTDSITGFSGAVVARAEFLYGCVRLEVQPEGLQEGKPIEPQWFDEQRFGKSTAKTGGPGDVPPPLSHP